LPDVDGVLPARSNKETTIPGISIRRDRAHKAILKQQQDKDAACPTGEPVVDPKTAPLEDILSTLNQQAAKATAANTKEKA
jgi:hypothetical protein